MDGLGIIQLNVQTRKRNHPLNICVLSQEEAGRLEHWGIWPTCKAHKHVKRTEALAAVASDNFRYVGGPDTEIAAAGHVSMIVPTATTRIWSPVACHDANGKAIQGFRTWGMQPLK